MKGSGLWKIALYDIIGGNMLSACKRTSLISLVKDFSESSVVRLRSSHGCWSQNNIR